MELLKYYSRDQTPLFNQVNEIVCQDAHEMIPTSVLLSTLSRRSDNPCQVYTESCQITMKPFCFLKNTKPPHQRFLQRHRLEISTMDIASAVWRIKCTKQQAGDHVLTYHWTRLLLRFKLPKTQRHLLTEYDHFRLPKARPSFQQEHQTSAGSRNGKQSTRKDHVRLPMTFPLQALSRLEIDEINPLPCSI